MTGGWSPSIARELVKAELFRIRGERTAVTVERRIALMNALYARGTTDPFQSAGYFRRWCTAKLGRVL